MYVFTCQEVLFASVSKQHSTSEITSFTGRCKSHIPSLQGFRLQGEEVLWDPLRQRTPARSGAVATSSHITPQLTSVVSELRDTCSLGVLGQGAYAEESTAVSSGFSFTLFTEICNMIYTVDVFNLGNQNYCMFGKRQNIDKLKHKEFNSLFTRLVELSPVNYVKQ